MKLLKDSGDAFLQENSTLANLKEAQQKRTISSLGVELLNKCLNMEDDIGDRAAIVLYMEGIIKLSKMRPGELKKAEKNLQSFLPLAIKKKLLENFSHCHGNSSRIVTPELSDRAICHVIVLALLANKGEVYIRYHEAQMAITSSFFILEL